MSNINFQCPHCSHSMQLPASVEGQQGNCPSCGVATVITSNPTPPVAAPLVQPVQPQYPQVTPDASNTQHSNTEPFVKNVLATVLGASSSEPTGNDRYPNLTKYLAVMDVTIRVLFIIALVLLILGVVLSILSGGYEIISAVSNGITYVWRGVLQIVFGILGGALYYLALIWFRLVALASLELIRVFMDNEANTRKALEK
jgi:hypothetical protein